MDREPEVVVHGSPATTYANRYFILPLLFCDTVYEIKIRLNISTLLKKKVFNFFHKMDSFSFFS
jgi:hypothetical protein